MGKKTCVLKDDFDVELVDGVKKDGDGVVYLNSRINGWDAIKAFYAANPHLLTLTELRRKGPSCSGPGLAPAGGLTPAGVGTTTTTSASAIPRPSGSLRPRGTIAVSFGPVPSAGGPQSRCDGGLRTTCTPHTSRSRRAACREPTPRGCGETRTSTNHLTFSTATGATRSPTPRPHRSSSRPGRASTTGCPYDGRPWW